MAEGFSYMTMKRISLSVFSARVPVAYRLACVFCALAAVLCCPAQVANAEKRESSISFDQMEQQFEKALANRSAELEELKSHRKRLEDLLEEIQEEAKIIRFLYMAHSQLLLESQPRIDTFENAIRENRLALAVLGEHIENLEDPMKSISDFDRQTTDRIETVREKIEEIHDSLLSADQKKLMEENALEALEVLEEKQQLVEQIETEYGELLNTMKDGIEAQKTIGEKLTTRLEILKKTWL